MNAKKALFFVLPVIALVMMACRVGSVRIDTTQVNGSGTLASESRNVEGVERVSLTDRGEMEIIQGSEEGLTVEADDNVLRYIETQMRGHELVIGIQNGIHIQTNNPIRYTLKVKTLNKISVSGSGDITAKELKTTNLGVDISGSGNVRIDNLDANDLRVQTSGSGNFNLAGTVKTQDVSISGSGNYEAGDLASQEAKLSISGSGNVTMWASDALDIHVSGFGNVNYYGSPKITQSITGGGAVRGLGEH